MENIDVVYNLYGIMGPSSITWHLSTLSIPPKNLGMGQPPVSPPFQQCQDFDVYYLILWSPVEMISSEQLETMSLSSLFNPDLLTNQPWSDIQPGYFCLSFGNLHNESFDWLIKMTKSKSKIWFKIQYPRANQSGKTREAPFPNFFFSN